MPYAVDLFCGAGGCSEGLIQAGFHILFSSDISDMVEVTYKHRHEQLGLIQGKNTWFERSDIRDLTGDDIRKHITELEIFKGKEMPEIDLMIGGPSCQGFSRAGRRDKSDPEICCSVSMSESLTKSSLSILFLKMLKASLICNSWDTKVSLALSTRMEV